MNSTCFLPLEPKKLTTTGYFPRNGLLLESAPLKLLAKFVQLINKGNKTLYLE